MTSSANPPSTRQSETSIVVEQVVPAPAERLFALLADPARHQDIDGSGMVRAAAGSEPVTATGQTFVMDMRQPGRDYRMENHVTQFELGRLIEWMPARVGAQPVGMRWRWELAPLDDGRTLVVHTYDWSGITDPDVLARITLPRVPAEDLERSVRRLGALA
jgi:uncharacterized protein YndB with AHSA1/START domain